MKFVKLSEIERQKPIALDKNGNFLTVNTLESNEVKTGMSFEEQQKLVLKRYEMEPDFAIGRPGGDRITKAQLMNEIRTGTETGKGFINDEMAYLTELYDDLMGRSRRVRFEDLINQLKPESSEVDETTDPKFVFADSVLNYFLSDIFKFKRDHLIPAFQQAGLLVQIAGRNDTRANFFEVYASDSVKYISESGHGAESSVCGYDQDTILWKVGSSEYPLNNVNNKIIHLCSCLTAVDLGPALVEVGATAYFGYDKRFEFYNRLGPHGVPEYMFGFPFFLTASGVDVFLLCGFTCEDTALLTRALYDYWIELTRSSNMFPGLIPSMLTHNRKAFKSPLDSEKSYGRKNAALNVPPLPTEITGRLLNTLLTVPTM